MLGVDLLEGMPGALVVVLVTNRYCAFGRLRLQVGLDQIKRIREELPDHSSESSEKHAPVQDHVTIRIFRVPLRVCKLICTCNQIITFEYI